MPTAILKPKGEDRVRGGHPWVYRSDIADVIDPEAGAMYLQSVRGTIQASIFRNNSARTRGGRTPRPGAPASRS